MRAACCVVAITLCGLPLAAVPFWSTRELGTYAIDGTGGDYLGRGLTHVAVTWVTLFAVAMAVSAVRLRLARIPVPGPLPN